MVRRWCKMYFVWCMWCMYGVIHHHDEGARWERIAPTSGLAITFPSWGCSIHLLVILIFCSPLWQKASLGDESRFRQVSFQIFTLCVSAQASKAFRLLAEIDWAQQARLVYLVCPSGGWPVHPVFCKTDYPGSCLFWLDMRFLRTADLFGPRKVCSWFACERIEISKFCSGEDPGWHQRFLRNTEETNGPW